MIRKTRKMVMHRMVDTVRLRIQPAGFALVSCDSARFFLTFLPRTILFRMGTLQAAPMLRSTWAITLIQQIGKEPAMRRLFLILLFLGMCLLSAPGPVRAD